MSFSVAKLVGATGETVRSNVFAVCLVLLHYNVDANRKKDVFASAVGYLTETI